MPQADMDGSPILAIEFNRVGGVLIPRTASKLISRRNGRSLRRLAHALPSHSKVPSLIPNASFSQLCRRSAESLTQLLRVLSWRLAASAILNRVLAKKAERRNPPTGRFITVDGVRLHYVERGTGRPLVLLHGNGSMIQDFESSGLVDLAAKKYRVIAFDRPGFGHSDRPRSTVWTPEAQADLLNAALVKMGVSQPLVLGHSWGTLVAVALALNYPRNVRALILASGYY